ncbi:MAG TPA: response regulator transcription factor [Candidatus Methanoperedenaceae archaeon]|nr:response regulator transcription factor [Candidatus Methanoperedenaceae archaeon]
MAAFKIQHILRNMHWREKELLEAIKGEDLTTTAIVERVHMCKATALKYLESLRKKGHVECHEEGVTKIWYLKKERGVDKKIKVLVADDDRNVLNIIRYSLEPEQFEILEAANGKEVLGVLFSELPDILILDIMMPELDGYRVCEEIKKHESTRNLPVLVLSAKANVEDKLKAMDLGVDDYMVKPFDPRELKARIKLRLKSDFEKRNKRKD